MSQDMVRQEVEEFGKDHGLIHEMIVTGRKVGAGRAFYASLTHSEELFRRVVAMVEQDPLQAAQHALLDAVAKGVTFENGVYRFFDPGTPLIILRDIPVIREKKIMSRQEWYQGYNWAQHADVPQERLLRVPVDGSFNLAFWNQKKLLTKGEAVPSSRIVAAFLAIMALSTGKRLLPEHYMRTADTVSGRVDVGEFRAEGFCVGIYWDDRCNVSVGLAAVNKSQTLAA